MGCIASVPADLVNMLTLEDTMRRIREAGPQAALYVTWDEWFAIRTEIIPIPLTEPENPAT